MRLATGSLATPSEPKAKNLVGVPARARAPWVALQGVIGVALAWAAAGRPINHDCAAILQFAQELIDRRLPYIDFVDVNPPLAYYWAAVPAFLARTLGLSIVVVFQVLVGAFVLATLVTLQAVLRRSRLGFTPAELGIVGLAWLASSWFVLRVGDWGQREHLFVLAYVPYLACRAVRYERATDVGTTDRAVGRVPLALAVFVGVQAALATFFKPTFLAAAVAVEIVYMLMHRTVRQAFRAEAVAFAAVGVAYALHWLLVPAAMREAFFGRWVPMLLEKYGAYGSATLALHVDRALVADLWFLTPVAGAATLLAVGLSAWRSAALRTPLAGLATLSLVSAAGYVQQYKAWVYHAWPFVLAGLLAAAFVAVQVRRLLTATAAADGTHRPRRPRLGAWVAPASAVAVFALGLFGAAVILRSAAASHVPPRPDRSPLVVAIEERTRPGDPVMVVTTSILDAYPMLLQKDRRSGTRYTCMFPLAMTYWDPARPPVRAGPLYRRRDEAPTEERRFLDELAADVRTRKPKLIAVWAWPGCQGCPLDFVILDYLRFNGFIDEAIAPGYVDIGQDGPFRFFVPKPPPGHPPPPPIAPPPIAAWSPPRL